MRRYSRPFPPSLFPVGAVQITAPVIICRRDHEPEERHECLIAVFSDGDSVCAASASGMNEIPGRTGICSLHPEMVGDIHSRDGNLDAVQDVITHWISEKEDDGYEIMGQWHQYPPKLIEERIADLRRYLSGLEAEPRLLEDSELRRVQF